MRDISLCSLGLLLWICDDPIFYAGSQGGGAYLMVFRKQKEGKTVTRNFSIPFMENLY